MTRSDLFRTAHKMTKEDKRNYPNITYRFQFGLNLKSLYGEIMNKKEFKFNFDFTNDPRKGTPYAAKLYIENGKIERNFFDLQREWGKKQVTVYGEFIAKTGDIIEQREGGSWNNDYRYWYLVDENGKLTKVADISNSQEKIKVKKYLKNEITMEEL